MLQEKIKELFAWYMRKSGGIMVYDSWSDEFKMKEFKKTKEEFNKRLSELIDFNKLTYDDMLSLGFVKWNDDDNIMLIPLYLFPIIPKGLEVIDIFGNTVINDGTNLDNDSRFGCIAYGICPYKEKI